MSSLVVEVAVMNRVGGFALRSEGLKGLPKEMRRLSKLLVWTAISDWQVRYTALNRRGEDVQFSRLQDSQDLFLLRGSPPGIPLLYHQ